LYTRCSRTHSPTTVIVSPLPSRSSARYLVMASRITISPAVRAKTRWSAPLCILFLFLARDAEPRVGQRIEPLEVDLVAALVAVPELLGGGVHPAERLVHVPEITALL